MKWGRQAGGVIVDTWLEMHSCKAELHVWGGIPEQPPLLEDLCQGRDMLEEPQSVKNPHQGRDTPEGLQLWVTQAWAGTCLRDCGLQVTQAGVGTPWGTVAHEGCMLGQRHLWGILTHMQPLLASGDREKPSQCPQGPLPSTASSMGLGGPDTRKSGGEVLGWSRALG